MVRWRAQRVLISKRTVRPANWDFPNPLAGCGKVVQDDCPCTRTCQSTLCVSHWAQNHPLRRAVRASGAFEDVVWDRGTGRCSARACVLVSPQSKMLRSDPKCRKERRRIIFSNDDIYDLYRHWKKSDFPEYQPLFMRSLGYTTTNF